MSTSDVAPTPILAFALPGSEVLARPRLEGRDDRRPDFAMKAMQAAVMRDFQDKPKKPLGEAAVSVRVFDDGRTPAAGVLKAVIDAAHEARVIWDDRFSVKCARLEKIQRSGGAPSSVNVEVMNKQVGPDEYNQRYYSTPVFEAIPYVDRSGVPGTISYVNPWVAGYPDYVQHLREQWDLVRLLDALSTADGWNTHLSGAWLHVELPDRSNVDPDNALLYVIDLLEVARYDSLKKHADDDPTVDELISQVSFSVCETEKVQVKIRGHEASDQYGSLPYFRPEGESVDPFMP